MVTKGPLSNQILGNKYLLGELLGQGGFGAVYKAQNLLLNRPQAVKVLLESHFHDPSFRARFTREAQTLASLKHPHILPVYDFEVEENMSYLVMPFISGGTLESILKQQGPLRLEEVEFYLEQICAALGYVHARNVVHLDLKPLNLLHQDGILLLSDFGLAHLMKEGALEGGMSLKFGSLHYMAPEHLLGQPERRSDLYALGVILYQMLVGRVPFEGFAQLMEPPPPLRAFRPELPMTLEPVLGKALAKMPEERYETANQLLLDFKVALPAPPPQAYAASTLILPIAQTNAVINPPATPPEQQVVLEQANSLLQPSPPPAITQQPVAAPITPPGPNKRTKRLYVYFGLIALLIALVGSSLVLYVPALFRQKGPQLNSVVGQVKFVPPGSYDEVQIIILHSIGNAPLGMHYYAWFNTGAKPLSWPLTTTQNGQVSSTPYPVSKGRNLLLLVDFFLITREGPGSVDIFPTPIPGDRLYYANISSTKSSFDIMPCPPTSSDDICSTKLI